MAVHCSGTSNHDSIIIAVYVTKNVPNWVVDLRKSRKNNGAVKTL